MRHPPYHLRPNKAIDRFLLVETLKRVNCECPLSGYTYYGLGGPLLEDCRILNDSFPELKLVSLESNKHTYRRQEFHKFSKRVELRHCNTQRFIPSLRCTGKEIVWLDYTDLKRERFNEFSQLLLKAECGMVVKITLRAEPDNNPYETEFSCEDEFEKGMRDFRSEFNGRFRDFLPGDESDKHFRPGEFPNLLQRMLRIAAQKALPASGKAVFQPIHSAYYSDGTLMLSLTGIVWNPDGLSKIRRAFNGWEFRNTKWQPPHHIDVPILSTKERLLLERLLPLKSNTGKALARELGYRIADSEAETLRHLKQYADFHRYYPYLAKVSV